MTFEEERLLKAKIKKYLIIISMSILMLYVVYSCIWLIRPAEVGVVVDMFGDKKGVEQQELTTGMYFTAPWKVVYKFPTYEQNHEWTGNDSFTFQTAEGLSVSAEIGINYSLEANKIHLLFAKYRKGMDEITHLFVKNTIRDAINKVASRMKIEELYGEQKETFFKTVYEQSAQDLKPLGFNLSRIFIIGKFNVPEIVLDALNKKIEATQRAQQRENELRESQAQAQKAIAEAEGIAKSKIIAAKSEAESNQLVAKSITPEILKMEYLKRWDGKLPQAITSDNGLLFDLRR